MLARLRAEAPIAYVPQLASTLLTRHDDIMTCEKQIDVFSSDQPAGLMTRLMGHNMMRKDGAAHMAERKVILPAMSPKTVSQLWTARFQAQADRILSALAPAGRADLCAEFALPFSGECLKEVTGLTNISYQEMDAWSQAMIDGIANYLGDPAVERRCRDATAAIDRAIDDRAPVLEKHPDAEPARRHAGLGHAARQRPRQHQAGDLRRAERAARRDRRRGLGASHPSPAIGAGPRGKRAVARRPSRNMRAGSRPSACRRGASPGPGG